MNTHSLRIGLETIVVIALLATPLWLRPHVISGDSMLPTLERDDVVLVDVLSLGIISPRRGELVVFRNPHRIMEGEKIQVDIKRIIGLPGETVHVRDDRVVVSRACGVDGVPSAPHFAEMRATDDACQTTYVASTLIGNGRNGKTFDMYLGPLDHFVLGDNRRNSGDSRTFGAVQPENWIGRPLLRIWPLARISFLSGIQ